MTNMRDLHLHTRFSCDSQAEMEQYLAKALADGVETICFTDHVDLNKADYGYQFYVPDAFFAEFARVREKVCGKIELLAGIEFGEPHLYTDALQNLSVYPYDMIIGSIHWVGDKFPCQQVRTEYTAKEFFLLYWQEMLKTVRTGYFDVLGHMDFPKRYYGEVWYDEKMINEIFGRLLEKDAVIEINTSSLRKGAPEPMPGRRLLEQYKAAGGRYVTIGSDAHRTEDLCADYAEAKKLLAETGLQEAVYRQRKRIVVP